MFQMLGPPNSPSKNVYKVHPISFQVAMPAKTSPKSRSSSCPPAGTGSYSDTSWMLLVIQVVGLSLELGCARCTSAGGLQTFSTFMTGGSRSTRSKGQTEHPHRGSPSISIGIGPTSSVSGEDGRPSERNAQRRTRRKASARCIFGFHDAIIMFMCTF